MVNVFHIMYVKYIGSAYPPYPYIYLTPLSKFSYYSIRDFCQDYRADANLYFVGLQISFD
jgi:hypothetical protein